MSYPSSGPYGNSGGYGPTGPGYTSQPPSIDFGWIAEAWAVFRTNPSAWIGAQLLFVLVAVALEFVLLFATGTFSAIMQSAQSARVGGPGSQPNFAMMPGYWAFVALMSIASFLLMGGLFKMAARHVRGEPITAVDCFSIGDSFGSLIGLGLLISLCVALPGGLSGRLMATSPAVGIPLYVVVLLAQSFLIFAPLAVVVEGKNPIEAVVRSFQLIGPRWLMVVLYNIVLGIVAALGIVACCVGALATYPLYFLGLAIAFLRLTDAGGGPSGYLPAASPGAWPPPPGAGQTGGYPPYGQPPGQGPIA